MTTSTLITITPDQLAELVGREFDRRAETLIATVRAESNPEAYALTVAEVAKKIRFSAYVVRKFIRDGRMDRTGQMNRLPALQITGDEYRVRPAELDKWLSQF